MTTAQRLRTVALTALASFILTLLVLNLSLGDKQVDDRLERLHGVGDAAFLRTMGSVLGPGLLGGNRIETLVNGAEFFPAMLESIRAARHSVTFESYIYWSGSIGQEFSAALSERAASGVRVHVLLDWIGGRLDDAHVQRMREAGVEIRRYNSPHWYSLDYLNHRTHRKLLVVDGRVGFIGGAGIGNEWRGDAQDAQHWRDNQYRVQGPVVAQLQSAFIDNWLQATGRMLHGDAYFPALQPAGQAQAQVFTSAPGGGREDMQLLMLMSITAAARSIRLSSPYFLPDEVAVQSLVAARRRGVRVQVIVPGAHIDLPLVRWASRATWGPLLAAGVEICEYVPTMIHVKLLVVDELWSSVGSANFDTRSFSINDEANMNVHDAAFAHRQLEVFKQDLRHCRAVTLQQWRGRPLSEKALDFAASLLSSQL
ncbi:phospholipase D-like domain-containing protein [Azohydromonas australica]|uniref:phospholipase D-like domain-containing protein n=1 Tax=Azohydromonas australica TaxID=364039 RepID=UPI001EE46047|nr:phospholipase D-like domain-containing protein [Azohydromonas australica]